jgi:hypothetical protein
MERETTILEAGTGDSPNAWSDDDDDDDDVDDVQQMHPSDGIKVPCVYAQHICSLASCVQYSALWHAVNTWSADGRQIFHSVALKNAQRAELHISSYGALTRRKQTLTMFSPLRNTKLKYIKRNPDTAKPSLLKSYATRRRTIV